jgi:hypothetical protein
MDIAILRTEQADRERLYNALEFSAAYHGARLVAYIDDSGEPTFRGRRAVTMQQLAERGVELVVAASPLTVEQRQTLKALGWTGSRVISFATHPGECVERFRSGSSWLATRRPRVTAGELQPETHYAYIGDVAVSDLPSPLSSQSQLALTERLFAAYLRATTDLPRTGPYVVGRNWGDFLRASRPTYHDAVARGDIATLSTLLASCFRNEMTSGMFSGGKAYEVYEQYRAAGRGVIDALRHHFGIWRYSVGTPDVSRLVSPPVGNPYGVYVDDGIVHPNTFLNDYRAQYVLNLLGGVDRPIVVDLGGGFGGFGHQLLTGPGNAVYVNFDLPDNLLVASYFLMASHPDKRVLLYESADQVLDAETLRQYDIILMPNFMVPNLADGTADVFTNFISLSEMEFPTIAEYLRQIDRVSAGFFYQENMLDNGENYRFFPVSVFPPLDNFAPVFCAPSRWPFFSPTSTHHCHGEFLSVRRDIDRHRYLGLPSAQSNHAAVRIAA